MYKCSDCGKEFDIKPDYCDCGNNVFEEIVSVEKEPVKIQENTIVQNKSIKKYSASEESFLKRINLSLYAIIIFLICILLSILSIIFIGRDSLENAQTNEPQQKTVLTPTKNIPSVESLWNNAVVQVAPVVVPPVEVKPVVQPVKPVQQIKKIVQQPKKVETKPQPKPKTVVQQPVKTVQTPKVDVQKYIPKTDTSSTVTKPAQTTQTTQTVQKKTNNAALQQELLSYKIALRNRIASNINFAQVVGDGKCAVTFKIDHSGNLINRKFSLQSPNNSLNDVVYSAMLKNPQYQSPPSGYNNETLTLSVSMYGGSFEVDLR